MTFQFIDAVFSLIILVCAVSATVKGFIHELFSKLAFFLGLFAASIFTKNLAPYLTPYIKVDVLCTILAFIIIFVLVYLIVRLIQQAVKNALDGEVMDGLDHSLGFLFGVFEGLIVVACILLVFYTQPWFDVSFLDRSFFSRILSSILVQPTNYVKGLVACV
ncbi:MAG: CvpA family protein [Treponemataceae bacterium]|nr:CvpA family protein [Treponemataceae bacterium]